MIKMFISHSTDKIFNFNVVHISHVPFEAYSVSVDRKKLRDENVQTTK